MYGRRLVVASVVALAATSAVAADPTYALRRRVPACCTGGSPVFAASLAASARGVLVGVPGQGIGRALLFDADGGGLLAPLDAPVRSRDFGRTVAATDDLLVVGAPDAGAVYVFDARSRALVQTLRDPHPDAERSEFGQAIAIAGDAVVVGAPFADRDGRDAGAAYVFGARSGRLRLALTPPRTALGARFGTAVAIAGDDVVVGATSEGARDAAGSVVAYSLVSGAVRWRKRAPNGLFGYAIAIGGRDVVVGAPGRDGDERAGAAFVLDRRSGTTRHVLAAPEPDAGDFFGGAVAVADGTVVVGARLAGERDTGAVHVFASKSGRRLASFADGASDAAVGWSVATRGDRVIVGAAGADGDVRVYERRRD